jgi:hypothetical protein
MKVIAKPVIRTYEVLLTEEDLRSAVGLAIASDTIQVTHVDHAPRDDEFMVRICITGVPTA